MWNNLKDFATAAFYVAGALTLTAMIYIMGIIVIIPALFYGTYKVFQIRRNLKKQQEQTNEQTNYTARPRHRAESHED